MLGHKTSLSAFKETEIIPSVFSNHNAMRLKINYKKKKQKYTHVKIKQHAHQRITQKNQRRNFKISEVR